MFYFQGKEKTNNYRHLLAIKGARNDLRESKANFILAQ